jgi:hypothetical protein
MDDWLSYSLGDLLPLSRDTYLHLFERYNAGHWPAVLIGLGLGAWLSLGAARGSVQVRMLALLGLCWLWIAWSFLWRGYAPLNWPAGYAAWAFALQGVLLVAVVPLARRAGLDLLSASPAAAGLLLFAWLGLPLLELLSGRSWQGLGWLGTAPDPTALATLALIAALGLPLGWVLAIIPAAWCAYSALTLFAMGDPLWPVAPIGVLVALWAGRPRA